MSTRARAVESALAKPQELIVRDVGVTNLALGLPKAEAEGRSARYGANAIESHRTHPALKFLSFFWGPIPWMIEVAAVLSAVAHRGEEFAIIASMLLINAGVGFFEEYKAGRAIDALKQSLALVAHVLRDGRWRNLPAQELVPGDVVAVRLGNIVPADLELAGDGFLSVDQIVVVGTRGRTGLVRLMLGGVAEKVMHAADCSVLLTRRRADA